MGGFYMKMSNVKTSTVAKSAYNSRTKEYDETQNHTFNYSAKEDHVYHHVTLPDGCPEEWKEAEKLWNENEKFETAQNTERHGKQFIIAVPQELTQEQTEKAINEFQDYFAKMGYASQADQHEPESRRSADEVEKNRHVHILTTARKITNGEFEKVKEKKVYANDVDAQGKPIFNPEAPDGQKVPKYDPEKLNAWEQEHGRKFDFKTDKEEIDKVQKIGARNRREWERVRVQDNPLDRRETVEAARAEWARICNSYLSEDQKIDHRSYERQGSERVAEIHEGIGSHKEQDDRKAYNEEVRQTNAKLEQAKQSAEKRLKEKGESHDNRESQTVGGDHRGADSVGGRATGGDRVEGQREQGNSSTVRDIPGQVPGEQRGAEQRKGSPQRDNRPFEQDANRASSIEDRLFHVEDTARQKMDGVGAEVDRDREQTADRSGRADRPERRERTSEERQQGASADYRQRVKEAENQRHGNVGRAASDIRREFAGTIRGYRADAQRVEADQRGIKEEQQNINREANANIRGQRSFTQGFNEHLERVRGGFTAVRDKLKGAFENVLKTNLQRAVERIRHLRSQAPEPEQEKPKQTTQEQPKQTQTAQSPLERMQQAQQMNATAEPKERSEDMSRNGANSLLAQAQSQNQAADQRERTAEKPQNDIMARFRQQKQETDQNRKEELEEVQQRTIHRGRHR